MKIGQWRRSKRLGVITAALTVSSLLLAACGGSGGDSDDATGDKASPEALDAALAKGGTITYWSWTPSAEAQVQAFMDEYKNVKVNFVNAGTGNDHYTKLQNAIKEGSGGPDVAQIEPQRHDRLSNFGCDAH